MKLDTALRSGSASSSSACSTATGSTKERSGAPGGRDRLQRQRARVDRRRGQRPVDGGDRAPVRGRGAARIHPALVRRPGRGRAHCSTCRVWILESLEHCSEGSELERAIAGPLRFGPEVRLACQTKVSGDLKLRRLVLDGTDLEITSQLARAPRAPRRVDRACFTELYPPDKRRSRDARRLTATGPPPRDPGKGDQP
jgi:hypothetical protein